MRPDIIDLRTMIGSEYAIALLLSLTDNVISTPPATLQSHSLSFASVRNATAGLGLWRFNQLPPTFPVLPSGNPRSALSF